MIRIDVVTETREEVVLKVEGWLSGEDVALLESEGERCFEQQGRRLVLDLPGIRLIDEAGIRLLRRWSGEKLALRGASPFVQALLETHGLG